MGAAALQPARSVPAEANPPSANVKPPQSKATKLSGSEGKGRSTVIGMQSKSSASAILGGDLADILGGEQAGSRDRTHRTLLTPRDVSNAWLGLESTSTLRRILCIQEKALLKTIWQPCKVLSKGGNKRVPLQDLAWIYVGTGDCVRMVQHAKVTLSIIMIRDIPRGSLLIQML